MSAIQKRARRYRVRWYDHTGARRSATFARESEAKAFARDRERSRDRIRAGVEAPPVQRRSLADVVAYLEEHRFPDLRSVATYRSIIRKHLMPALGHLALADINKETVDHFSTSLRCKSPKTRKNVLTLLKMVLRTAYQLQWLHRVPPISMPRVCEKDFAFLARPQEFAALIEAAGQERPGIAQLYATALYTGMRAGELAGLRRHDINLGTRRVRVMRTYNDEPTKNARIRWVPVLDPLLPILEDWLVRHHAAVVFPTRDGTVMGRSDRSFQEVFQRCLKRAGLPRIRFHDTRHSFAASWMMNGGNIYRLSKILGHSSVTVTERYAHLAPDAFEQDYGLLPGLSA